MNHLFVIVQEVVKYDALGNASESSTNILAYPTHEEASKALDGIAFGHEQRQGDNYKKVRHGKSMVYFSRNDGKKDRCWYIDRVQLGGK